MTTASLARTPAIDSRLPRVGTTIFTVMSALAQQHGAVNLGQGFPDFDCDPALLDAAQDLGANAWQRFWRVTFPLSRPGVFAGSALVFIPAFGIFAIPDILGGTGGIMIGNVIKQQFLDTRDWPFGSVLSMVLTVVAVGLAGLAAWFARRGRL